MTYSKKRISTLLVLIPLFGLVSNIRSQNCVPDANGNVTCNDFITNATQNIDLRIENKHNAAQNMPIYTELNHANAKYTRNVNCWAAGLDLTCASPWNSKGINLRAGTLITPRHAILAAHYNIQTGDSIRFITKDNVVVRRKVIAFTNNTDWVTNFPDIEVVTLDSDVPASIKPCQLLPSNTGNYISNDGLGLPGFFIDQDEKAVVANALSLGLSQSQTFDFEAPVIANRKSLYEPIAMGDSGNPVFVVLSGKLVLVGVVTSYGPWGYSLKHFSNLATGGTKPQIRIDDLIKSTDALAGINTGYKVSFFDFTTTASIKTLVDKSINVYTIGNTLKVEAKSITPLLIEVFDLFGRQILSQKSHDQLFNFELSHSGVYVVRVTKEDRKHQFKVIAR